MQARTVAWGGRCLVVMLRPSGKSDKEKSALESAVKDSVLKCNAPSTLYKWMPVSSDDEKFSAWNIGHAELLHSLLRKRDEGVVSFSVYYRFCGGVSIVTPEGEFFKGF